MESLRLTDDYSNLEKVENIRVTYDRVNDKVWFETPILCDFVDLGLPSGLKWATCNVGASKPDDFGLYFAWGETEGYIAYRGEGSNSGTTYITDANGNETNKVFNWADYKYCNGSETTLTKYCYESSYGADGFTDNLTTLELLDDAAYTLDNTCRMPTRDEFNEFSANTKSTWETLNGVGGRRFTSKTNDNSIFIPAAGCCREGSVDLINFCRYLLV